MGRPKQLNKPRLTTLYIEAEYLNEIDKQKIKVGEYVRDLLKEKFSNLDTNKELQKYRDKSKSLGYELKEIKEENRRLRIKLNPEDLLSEEIEAKAEELAEEYNSEEDRRIEAVTSHHKKLLRDYKPLEETDEEYKIRFKELVDKRLTYNPELKVKEAEELSKEQLARETIDNIPRVPILTPEYRSKRSFMEDAKFIVMEIHTKKGVKE